MIPYLQQRRGRPSMLSFTTFSLRLVLGLDSSRARDGRGGTPAPLGPEIAHDGTSEASTTSLKSCLRPSCIPCSFILDSVVSAGQTVRTHPISPPSAPRTWPNGARRPASHVYGRRSIVVVALLLVACTSDRPPPDVGLAPVRSGGPARCAGASSWSYASRDSLATPGPSTSPLACVQPRRSLRSGSGRSEPLKHEKAFVFGSAYPGSCRRPPRAPLRLQGSPARPVVRSAPTRDPAAVRPTLDFGLDGYTSSSTWPSTRARQRSGGRGAGHT